MIANRDIEKLVVINKEQAEIYLKKEALESGRYPKVPKPGTGFGMSVPKAHYTYNIGDISNFEPFLLDAQKNAGYTDKELIYHPMANFHQLEIRNDGILFLTHRGEYVFFSI